MRLERNYQQRIRLKILPLLTVLMLGISIMLSSCDFQVNTSGATSPSNPATNPSPNPASNPAPATNKKAGPDSLYPNPALTPGDVFPGVTAKEVCVSGYSKSVRDVSTAEKQEVFNRYGVTYEPGKYEVDHFIPLELGGSNNLKNLWPEPYEPRPGSHEKDTIENALHKEVCDGRMTLQQAQDTIKQDWYAYYLQHTKGTS